MRYGIKHGGVIYVGSPSAVVARCQEVHGDYRDRGNAIPGGWNRVLEPVDEKVLDLLRVDYTVEECEKAL